MKLLVLLLSLLLAPLLLSAGTLQITATRNKTDLKAPQTIEGTHHTKGTETCSYEVKVTNTSFKPTNAIKADYVIFVERQRLGMKIGTETMEEIKASIDIKPLASRATEIIKTQDVSLYERSLVGNRYYSDGGRIKAKDSIKGIWIRFLDGQTVVAEYANPSSMKSKATTAASENAKK